VQRFNPSASLSFYLDISLDGVIIYDRDFIKEKLERIREIISQAGLKRCRDADDFYWEWEKYPKPGRWKIDWDGYHECAKDLADYRVKSELK